MSDEKIIDFMGKRKILIGVSAVFLIVSIGSFFVNGLKLGLDFTGGTSIELAYENAPSIEGIRTSLENSGFDNVVVVNYGSVNDVMVRVQGEGDNLVKKITSTLKGADSGEVTVKQASFVGPQIGEELRDDGGIGMLFALIVVMAYVAIRFQFKFSVGAVGALVHDVIFVLGAFSLFQIEFDLTVLAAILAVIGYSLNDTIVVSDRIRENFRKMREGDSLEVINTSLSQTLGRTLVTSGTTLLVLFALFFIGGEMIHNFSLALIIGVSIGTYSSIYVAATILLAMNVSKEDLMEPVKEGEDLEDMMP